MKKAVIKCKIKNHDDFIDKLSAIDMEFGPVYRQHDRIYVPRDYRKGMNYPRLILRTEMKAVDRPARYEIILKRHIEDSGLDIEEKTVVKDYLETVKIFHQLGFRQEAEVTKQRQELTMGEGTKIFVDKIEGKTGFYAKIETFLEEDEAISEAKADLVRTMEVLGEKNVIESAYNEF